MSNDQVMLTFEQYFVQKASYELNPNFQPNEDEEKYNVDFTIKAIVEYDYDINRVSLIANVGSKEKSQTPFFIEIILTGYFNYNGPEDQRDSFLKINSVSIMFPYLRSLISEMSTKSNIFPPYILPLINVYEYLKNEENIEVIDSRHNSKNSVETDE